MIDTLKTIADTQTYTMTEEILWFLFFYAILLFGMVCEIWWRSKKSPKGAWPAVFAYIDRWGKKVIIPTAIVGLFICLIWQFTGFAPLIEGIKYAAQFFGVEFKEPPGDLIVEGELNALTWLIGFALMHMQNTDTMQKDKPHEKEP